jgi:hypothetical protein
MLLHLRMGGGRIDALDPISIRLSIRQQSLCIPRALGPEVEQLPGKVPWHGEKVGAGSNEVKGLRRKGHPTNEVSIHPCVYTEAPSVGFLDDHSQRIEGLSMETDSFR